MEPFNAGFLVAAQASLQGWARIDPGTVRVPVDLWYGAQDTSPVHSPDFGAFLSDRIPGARRHVISSAGGALLWTHAETILRTLLQH